jgi:hypothetical protein
MPPECTVRAQNRLTGAQFKLPGACGRKAIRLLGLLVWLSVRRLRFGADLGGFIGVMSGYSASCPLPCAMRQCWFCGFSVDRGGCGDCGGYFPI